MTIDEDDPGADDHQQALDRLDQPPADEVADRVEIVRRARQHLARRVPVVERARIRQVRLVEQLAHARLDANPDAGRRVAPREVDREAERGENEDRDEVGPQRRRVVDDRVVDRLLDEQRDRDRDQRVERARRRTRARRAATRRARAGAACGASAAGRGRADRRDSRIRAWQEAPPAAHLSPGRREQRSDDSKRLLRQDQRGQARERERASAARPSLKLGGANGCASGSRASATSRRRGRRSRSSSACRSASRPCAHARELTLAGRELRLASLERPLALLDGCERRRAAASRSAAPDPARSTPASRAMLPAPRARARERRAPAAPPRARRARRRAASRGRAPRGRAPRALALRGREDVLRFRLGEPGLDRLQLPGELTLALREACGLGVELGGLRLDGACSRFGGALALLERARALVRRELARGERPGGDAASRSPPRFGSRPRTPGRSRRRCRSASSRSRAATASARSRSDRFSCSISASPPRLGRLPALRELAGEPQQLGAVEIGPRLLAGCPAWLGVQVVEAFFPAIHRCPQSA